MNPAIEALRHTVSVYADTDDERRILTATSKSHPRPGEPRWTGLTMGDLRALLTLVDAQAARIDKALATCSKYQAAADVVVHPVRADAWRVLSDHVRRALTEGAQ